MHETIESTEPARQRRRPTVSSERSRWVALVVLCAGMLMIVLDATVVNVALPSIQSDLGFSQSSLSLETGLAFLPVTVVLGTLSLRHPERLITRFGARRTLLPGLVLIAAGSPSSRRCP
jgi:MFS family permease